MTDILRRMLVNNVQLAQEQGRTHATALRELNRLETAHVNLTDSARAFVAWFKEFDGSDAWRELNEPGACPQLRRLLDAIEGAI